MYIIVFASLLYFASGACLSNRTLASNGFVLVEEPFSSSKIICNQFVDNFKSCVDIQDINTVFEKKVYIDLDYSFKTYTDIVISYTKMIQRKVNYCYGISSQYSSDKDGLNQIDVSNTSICQLLKLNHNKLVNFFQKLQVFDSISKCYSWTNALTKTALCSAFSDDGTKFARTIDQNLYIKVSPQTIDNILSNCGHLIFSTCFLIEAKTLGNITQEEEYTIQNNSTRCENFASYIDDYLTNDVYPDNKKINIFLKFFMPFGSRFSQYYTPDNALMNSTSFNSTIVYVHDNIGIIASPSKVFS